MWSHAPHAGGMKRPHLRKGDETKGSQRGENVVFKLRLDGVDVIHMGDIGEECNVLLAEQLGACNILIIPIGGVYTIDAEQAKDYV